MKVAPLMTHDIGSLAKPPWRVKAMVGQPLEDRDIADAKTWGERLRIAEREELGRLLDKRQGFTPQEKKEILRFSSLYGIRLLENCGLDLVWDGEQHRVEMYEYPVRRLSGFHFHGHVRSFDNKYYRKASCEEAPSLDEPYHLAEYLAIRDAASREVKIPVTGAYTLVDWSYDSFYLKDAVPGVENIQARRSQARGEFLRDVASKVVHPNLASLHAAGAKFLQIDEPAATTKRGETGHFIQSMRDSIGDLAGKVFFSVHICYSDYSRLFPAIRELEGILDEVHLEYANRDSIELGVSPKARTGYEILKDLKKTAFSVGLGVLDIHSDFIEPPELVRDRILYACDIIQDPGRILVAPDCGLRTRSWEVSYRKLANMVEGRNLALSQLY